jgi:hypothetical protein
MCETGQKGGQCLQPRGRVAHSYTDRIQVKCMVSAGSCKPVPCLFQSNPMATPMPICTHPPPSTAAACTVHSVSPSKLMAAPCARACCASAPALSTSQSREPCAGRRKRQSTSTAGGQSAPAPAHLWSAVCMHNGAAHGGSRACVLSPSPELRVAWVAHRPTALDEQACQVSDACGRSLIGNSSSGSLSVPLDSSAGTHHQGKPHPAPPGGSCSWHRPQRQQKRQVLMR